MGESVDSNTFNMSGVILSSSLSGAIQHTLRHEESILLVDGPNVKVKLSAADIEAITKTRDLAKSKETTYVSIGASLIKDKNGLPVKDISLEQGQKAFDYVEDKTDPNITGFDLDMDSGKVTLKFDEVMKLESLKRKFLTLQNLIQNPTESFTLNGEN